MKVLEDLAMHADGPCLKCGSKERIPDARVVDRGDSNFDVGSLQVAVYRRPSAVMFKSKVVSDVYANICAQCGFTELYTAKPQVLHEAWLEGQRNP
jgi:predicted nucleic-acid-binding Zn-ribbon protein